MQFLAPLFLVGLAAVAIPIVLHLIRRERRVPVPFPSLMFLCRIPHRTTSRRRLRDLPLLALRVLALVLLATAFSRPLLERGPAPVSAGGARELVLLLDRSYSMGVTGRWEAAQSSALAEVAALQPGDRMSIIAFDGGAAVMAEPTRDARALRALINELRPGWGGTRYDPALRRAGNLLAASDLPRREVVLVSDYQRGGTGDGLESKLPAGTVLRGRPVGESVPLNLAVADVSFSRESFEGSERVTATARIVNTGTAPARDASVVLELDGRRVRTETVSVPAHGASSITLPPFALAGPVRGSVSVGGDALVADDVHSFALAPGQALRVVALDGGGEQSLYLARALEVGGEPGFAFRNRSGSGPTAAELGGVDVVILNDVPAPEAAAVQRLRTFVEQGGGLLVVLGPGSGMRAELAALLPGTPGQLVDRTDGGGASLGQVELAHPVFDVFRAPRSGDLGAPRFYRYRALRVSTADSSVSVLARFDDGAVALAERRFGRGRVLVWTSTLDRAWNDLAIQPVYLPFVHRLLRHAAGFEQPRAAHTVGEVVDVRAAANVGEDVAVVVILPDGTRRLLAAGERALTLEQRGFHTVRAVDRSAVLATIAANIDVRESELATLDPAALAASVHTPGAVSTVASEGALSPRERERRQSLWWYLLATALALLAFETGLSNWISRRTVRAREG